MMTSHSDLIEKYGRPNNWTWGYYYELKGLGYINISATARRIMEARQDVDLLVGVDSKMLEGKDE